MLVAPADVDIGPYKGVVEGVEVLRIENRFLESENAYNALLRQSRFYEYFQDFKFVLVHQLDCYVFRDEVNRWCSEGYDYVGAPWTDFEWLRDSSNFLRWIPWLRLLLKSVGNGGFSLRRVSTLRKAARLFRLLGENWNVHEDLYWSNVVGRFYPSLKIPSFRKALGFAFERNPRRCYEMNGEQLPFGCHAFEKHDLEFWLSKLEAADAAVLRAAADHGVGGGSTTRQ